MSERGNRVSSAETARPAEGRWRRFLWTNIHKRFFDAAAGRLRAASVHEENGRLRQAEALYRQMLERDPGDATVLSRLGRLLLRDRHFEEAVEILQRAADARPNSTSAAFQLSRALHRNGQLDEAVERYLRVVELDPAHEKARSALAEIATRRAAANHMADVEAAARIARRLTDLEQDSSKPGTHALAIADEICAGAHALAEASPQAALARFAIALDVAPELIDALAGMARCYRRLGQLDEAIDVLSRQISVDPGALEPVLQRDRLHGMLGLDAQALSEPDAAWVLEGMEERRRQRQQRRARAQQLAARLRGDTGLAPIGDASREEFLRIAAAAFYEGRLDDAEELYQAFLSADPSDAEALVGLAKIRVQRQRLADAMARREREARAGSILQRRQLARALMQEQRFEAARALYAELSETESASVEIWQALGQANKRLGQWQAACDAWDHAVGISPERSDLRLEIAAAHQQDGRPDDAAAALEALLEHDPDHAQGLVALGRLRFATDPDRALACWFRLAELLPTSLDPRLQIARLHDRCGRPVEAEAAFRRVLEFDSRHGEALASLGRIVAPRDGEEAERLFLRSTEAEPRVAASWLTLGRFYAGLKRMAPAEAAFRSALACEPSNTSVLIALGRLHAASKRYDEAMEVWSALCETIPDAVEPKLQVARILDLRQDEGTERALRDVLAIDPTHDEALARLARWTSRDRQRIDVSLGLWNELARLDTESVVPFVERGRLLERYGRLEEAEAEYRRAVARGPRTPLALANLAQFLDNRHRWREAIEVHRAHLAIEPDRVEVIVGMGRCFDRSDRLAEAEELYDRALALQPDNLNALGYRARVRRTLGQIEGSITDFRRICALQPDNHDAWNNLIFYLAGAEREEEALVALDAAEAALGDGARALATLGRTAATALFEERAIGYFQRAIAVEPGDAMSHAELGQHYLKQGVLDRALRHLLDSRERDPGSVEVARGLFDATSALGALGIDHLALVKQRSAAGDILVPERLFDQVRTLAETTVTPYEPVPRSVVMITATLAPGGAERQMVNLLRGLSDARFGLRLSLMCVSLTPRLRRNFFLPVLQGTSVEVVSMDGLPDEDRLWRPEVRPFAHLLRHFPPDMVEPITFWLEEFRRHRPAVVHAWQDSTSLMAVVAALLAGVPRIVLCCRSVHPDNPRRRLRRFMREAYRAVLRHPSVVLSNNSRAGALDYAEWLDIDPGRIEVVYNGVDFGRLEGDDDAVAAARRELAIPDDAPVLGSVFRMSEEKRPLLWLDTAAALLRRDARAHFVVCGDGPMRDEMVRHAAALGLSDRLHLPGARTDIGVWYRLMDVVMLTSRHEGLPNVLLEAQLLGIPVVAPDVGGMSEVVEQGVTGWTVKDADAESLAARVAQCLTDDAWRGHARVRGPAFVQQHFSIPAMLRRNLDVYGIPEQPTAAP